MSCMGLGMVREYYLNTPLMVRRFINGLPMVYHWYTNRLSVEYQYELSLGDVFF